MSSEPPLDRAPPPGSWKPARAMASAIVSPIQRILAVEAASGILLMVATAVALVLANSRWHADFEHLWHRLLDR
jgi:Na+:H+ antiporter, NhaA family